MSKVRRSQRRGAWNAFWTKVLTKVFRRAIFTVRPLDVPIPPLHSCLPVSITTLSSADLAEYLRFYPLAGLSELQRRLSQGHRCYASWYQGQIVDVTWIAAGRAYIDYLDRDILLHPQDAYLYDSFTSPAFRGRGLYAAKLAYISHRCKEEGYSRTVAVYAMENKAVYKMLARLNTQYVGTYYRLKIGPWQMVWRSGHSDAALPTLVKPASTERKARQMRRRTSSSFLALDWRKSSQ